MGLLMRGDAKLVSNLQQRTEMPHGVEIDMFTIAVARRNDLEELAAANRAACENLHAMLRMHSEMLTEALQRVEGAARSANDGDEAKAELARTICDRALSELKARTEKAFRAQNDAMADIDKLASQQVTMIQHVLKTFQQYDRTSA